MFKEQLLRTEINREKIKEAGIHWLNSLMSQINYYLPKELITAIQQEAKELVPKILKSMTVEQKRLYFENQWSKEEKWVMTWAMKYASKRLKIRLKKIGYIWEEIFKPRCPYKENNIKSIKRNRYITKAYIVREEAFTKQEYDIMDKEIDQAIKENTPIEYLKIELPKANKQT